MVAGSIAVIVGVRRHARKGWDRVSASVSSHEARVCEWDFPVCGDGFQQDLMAWKWLPLH